MTVKELIAELQKYDQDCLPVIYSEKADDYVPIKRLINCVYTKDGVEQPAVVIPQN